MIYLGYIFTTLGYISYWIGRFFKKKSVMMATNSLSSLFLAISFIFFNSYHGIANQVLVVARGIFINYKDKRQKPMHWLFVLFVMLFLIVTVIFWSGWASVFALITMLINIYANWYLPPQKLRIATVLASCFYEGFLICIGNWSGVALELTIIISNFVSWYRYRRISEFKTTVFFT